MVRSMNLEPDARATTVQRVEGGQVAADLGGTAAAATAGIGWGEQDAGRGSLGKLRRESAELAVRKSADGTS